MPSQLGPSPTETTLRCCAETTSQLLSSNSRIMKPLSPFVVIHRGTHSARGTLPLDDTPPFLPTCRPSRPTLPNATALFFFFVVVVVDFVFSPAVFSNPQVPWTRCGWCLQVPSKFFLSCLGHSKARCPIAVEKRVVLWASAIAPPGRYIPPLPSFLTQPAAGALTCSVAAALFPFPWRDPALHYYHVQV